MKRVIGIGDNVCDKYYPSKIMYPGGQAMNFSVLQKNGSRCSLHGRFGTDSVARNYNRWSSFRSTIPDAGR